MPDVTTHAPGSFCWFELGTTNQNAAKQFYASLAGWTAADFPMGPGEVYTMFNLDARNVGACYTLNKDMLSRGVPPHWLLYIAVADADATAAKVESAGGKIIAAPFDVMDFGRMAVCQDPAGAVFAVWQAKSHHGTGVKGVPGTFCWADLSTPDTAGATAFYQTVLGWKVEKGQDDSGYLHIKNGEEYIGGIPPGAHRDPHTPPHWLLYLLVTDCDASTAKAVSLGAKVYCQPMSMENVGRWSIIADPQGAVVALFQGK